MIHSNLKAIADKAEKSIRQIAKDTGYRYETVRQMYNDESKHYPRDMLDALCKYLECSPGDLLKFIEIEKEQ